jgi:uncharacterized protein (DUF1501 family)
MTHIDASRRQWLCRAAALSAHAAAAPLALNLAALGSAAAQGAGDYKALVCLFLFGGNDAYNTMLPTDSASWVNYTAVRSQAPDPIALLAPGTPPNPAAGAGTPARLGGVLPLMPAVALPRPVALHPVLGPLQGLFNTDRRLAVLSNIGPLVMPTTKAQYALASHPKPENLYSHNDQANTWQALAPEGATRGWGGRMGDHVAAMNGMPVFTSVSAAGNAVWLAGDSINQYQVSSNGAIRLGSDSSGKVYGSSAVAQAMERIVGSARGSHVLEADLSAVAARSMAAELALRNALRPAGSAPFGTPPAAGASYSANDDPLLRYPNPLTGSTASSTLAQQLQVVARMIDAGRTTLGARRQVFFVSLGGFDTHDTQNRNQADLLARLAHGMAYFDAVMGGLGLRNQVTLFTASDFGRTFTSNGDGTDHGWGGHHFVMGGAVRGGAVYGALPVLGAKNATNNNFDSSPDQLGNGALLPTTSVDQLGATLGRWFGLSDAELLDLFPNLVHFGTRDLGFI